MSEVNDNDGITAEVIRAEAAQLFGQLDRCDKEHTLPQMLSTRREAIACLAEPFLQKVGLACLAGSSDTGKSALLRQLSIAVASGDGDFLGFPIRAVHRSVVYVSTEDGLEATSYLMQRQTERYTMDTLEGLRFIFEADHDLLTTIDQNLRQKPADMVVVDCFSDAYGGDLKDTQKIRTYLQLWQTVAERHECLILFLHHTAKRTESLLPSKNNLLSGQGFEAKMRLVIELRADAMYPSHRHLCIVKGNYLPAAYKRESYVLDFDERHFRFAQTGQRTPFELLTRSQETDEGRTKYEQAKELKDAGKSYSEIAEVMGYGSKGSVSALFAKARKLAWDASEEENEE